ncbi:2,3-diaminopropionate biosynthesis protein SbnB [Streptomyces sp. NPDC088760]|uniref:2,3-diaminopropionate biosynthesis protein SbnB n=1 Tax=Streptomyces sp. NPDC088760 TaxID=3365890 RepID=UPI00382D8906
MFEFDVVNGRTVRDIVRDGRRDIVRVVRDTYLAHHAGRSVNPDSYFLRFPEKPADRIIALPAYLDGEREVAGIKWIASFPANIERGIPRASATLVLNDAETGYPFALLEASQISAARTAASAVLAADVLTGGRKGGRLAVVGAGIIARNILEFFHAEQWTFEQVVVHDLSQEYGTALAAHATERLAYPASYAETLQEAVSGADLVVFATTAGEPYVLEPDAFAPGQIVLNISLRDIGPELIVGSYNVLDDVDHCLKANTSPHLAEQKYGNRDFITGTLAEVINGEVTVGTDKPVVFSPFGLGVLDLAVGLEVHRVAAESGRVTAIADFFGETERW